MPDSSYVEADAQQVEIDQLRAKCSALEAEVRRLRAPEGPAAKSALDHQALFSAIQITRMPMILTDPDQDDNPIIFANRAFCEMTGYAADELTGRNCRFLQGADTDQEQVKRIGDAVRQRERIALDIVNYKKDGSRFVNELYISPVYGPAGELLYYFGSQVDVTSFTIAQRKLGESEAKYKSLFNALDEGFFILEFIDGEDGPFSDYIHVEANAAFVRNAGIDAVGKSVRQLVPAEADKWIALYRRVVETGEPARFEHTLQANGRRLEVAAFRLGLPDRRQVAVLFKDVTARRRDEDQLRLLSTRLDALVRSSSEVRYLINADWSELCQLSGTGFIADTGEPNRNWLEEYIPPEDRAAVRAEIARAVAAADTYQIEHRVYLADGSVGWVASRAVPLFDEEGEVSEWYGAASNITERREAELALRRLADTLEEQVAARTAELMLYRNIVQSTRSPICAYDPQQRVTMFNEAHADDWRKVMGREALIGDVLPDLLPAGQGDAQRAFAARALAGETFTIEAQFGDPDLEAPHWEVDYAPVRDEAGVINGAFHLARDVTSRLKAEADLAETQDALRQSQKLEAVGQLTGGVAHDFNNLLTIIRSSVDFLKREDLTASRRARYVEAISDTVERASKLTNQLLAFARRQPLKPQVFEVSAQVQAVSELIRPLVGARVAIEVDPCEIPCFVEADLSQFETALVNLAVNARDAMAGEGRLTFTVREVAAVPAIRGHVGAQGSFVAVAVTDTGKGIAPDQTASIFEPFFTTKEVGKGTGLGLSQVFGFTKQSGGEVDVTSELGSGATFTLYLPRVKGELVSPPSADRSLQAAASFGLSILVVEDNEAVGRFADEMLRDLGYRTRLVGNAAEALEALQEQGSSFDVVFSDVIMPGMNGIDLAREIRRRQPGLPIVLTSGYSDVLAQEGPQGFELLRKPYSVAELARIISAVSATRTN